MCFLPVIDDHFEDEIKLICIVDTNCNPDLIPYPIPANDDSSSSINFILNYLVNRILTGYNKTI